MNRDRRYGVTRVIYLLPQWSIEITEDNEMTIDGQWDWAPS
jgi:hypothetical protein